VLCFHIYFKFLNILIFFIFNHLLLFLYSLRNANTAYRYSNHYVLIQHIHPSILIFIQMVYSTTKIQLLRQCPTVTSSILLIWRSITPTYIDFINNTIFNVLILKSILNKLYWTFKKLCIKTVVVVSNTHRFH
jgi:hypothetical protein